MKDLTIYVWAGTVLCAASCAINASGHEISGIVTDGEANPVEFANAVILNSADSTFVSGTVTDITGAFHLDAAPGQFLKISYIGFNDLLIDNPQGNLGELRLTPIAFSLGEVEIKAQRPVARLKDDGITIDINDTYLANTGTSLTLLGKMPFVTVSGSDVEVLGKGTPLIYINGRQVRDVSELDRLQSSQVKKVEVVTTPGARYDATVNAVIRITTLAPVGEGFSLNDRTTVGYKRYAYLFEQLNLNYRKGGLDLFGMLNYENYRERPLFDNEITQQLSDIITSRSNGRTFDKYPLYGAKAGFNYYWGEHSIGLFYDFSYKPVTGSGQSSTERMLNGNLSENLDESSRYDSRTRQHLVSAYYSGTIGKWQINANFDAMWKCGRKDVDKQELSTVNAPHIFPTKNNADNRLIAGNINVTHPIWKGDISIGTEINDIYRHDIYESPAEYISNNNTEIDETTTALFAETRQAFGNISLSAGLRWEYTDSRFYLDGTKQSDRSRTYHNFSPSASIDMPIGNVSMHLAYSRKTTRPAFEQLSSAIRYIDRYSYESGNPNLHPIYRDYISLSAQWEALLIEFDYTSTDNYFMWQTSPYPGTTGTTLLQMQNMPRFDSWSAMANYAPAFGCWRPVLMAGIMMQNFKITHFGNTMNLDKPLGIFRFNNAIHLPWDIWLDADLSFRTSGDGDNLHIESQGQFDLGIYKSFADDTWSVKLQLNDVFDTARQEFTMYDAISTTSVSKIYDTRDLQLTVRYNFNASRSRYKGQGAGNADKDRL